MTTNPFHTPDYHGDIAPKGCVVEYPKPTPHIYEAPDLQEQRPDIPHGYALRLKHFAANVEGLIETWQHRKGECFALDELVTMLDLVASDVIVAAKVKAREFEEQSKALRADP